MSSRPFKTVITSAESKAAPRGPTSKVNCVSGIGKGDGGAVEGRVALSMGIGVEEFGAMFLGYLVSCDSDVCGCFE